MNELIKIETTSDNPTVLGRDLHAALRDLHAALEVQTAYKDWFPRMCEYGFIDGTDYCSILSDRCDGLAGKPRNDHQLTIEMAKELCMLQRTDKGKEFRQYFIEIERRWNEPASVMARALQLAQKQISSLTETNQKLLPMAQFAESVMDSKDAISIGEAARVLHLGIGQNKLFSFLRDSHVLMPNNQPYQKYIDEGWFRCIESKYEVHGETHISIKTVVFQKGLKKIKRALRAAGCGVMYQDLKGALKAEGVTIKQLARKRGVSASYLNNVLNGRGSIHMDIAYEIMGDLKLNPDQIYKYFPPNGEREEKE